MTENKEYKKMTPEEQLKWLTDFSTFSNSKLPVLAQLGDAWETAHYKTFEEGLKLLNAFTYCREFVKSSMLYQDYSRRVSRMTWMVERIKKDLGHGVVMKGIDGERIVYVPTTTAGRHRGRPTKEEAAAAAAAEAENKVEEDKSRKIAEIFGATQMEKVPEREPNNEELLKEKRKQEAATPSLFQDMETAPQKTTPVDLAISSNRLHLDQITFLLTPETAQEVRRIREIRTSLSSAAERAKLLAEQGATSATIAPYADKAAELTKAVENIYLKVDSELARLYILMPMDNTLDGHREAVEAQHLTDRDLLTMLKPYYDKRKSEDAEFEKKVIEKFEASRPEVVAARKAEAKKKSEINALRKYIMRTDKKPTQTRIDGIRERIERLKELGEDVSALELILNKTIEENRLMK